MRRRVLLVDDNAVFAQRLMKRLERPEVEVVWVNHGSQVPNALEVSPFDVAVVEAVMPGMSGVALLDYLAVHAPSTKVIMVAASASLETAVAVMKRGAIDYLVKPVSEAVLADTVRTLLAAAQPETAAPSQMVDEMVESGLVGECPAMREVLKLIGKIASTNAPVLISGESGTGKELVARSIHQRSQRAGKVFLALNCGALPEGLIESELFGHVAGAFTGAHSSRRGLFEEADGGAIFLDEIASTPLGFQVKLLRVLEDGEVRAVGSGVTVRTDVRIIAAANVDLRAAVRAGRFREDLYYRLNVVGLHLPPLRERTGDISILAHHFAERAGRQQDKPEPVLSPRFMGALLAHRWPGNVRELRNCIERAVLFAETEELTDHGLGTAPGAETGATDADEVRPYSVAKATAMAQFRREYIRELLHLFGGNITRAAAAAEVPRQTIHRLLREIGERTEERHKNETFFPQGKYR